MDIYFALAYFGTFFISYLDLDLGWSRSYPILLPYGDSSIRYLNSSSSTIVYAAIVSATIVFPFTNAIPASTLPSVVISRGMNCPLKLSYTLT